jgi:hypothetical protein
VLRPKEDGSVSISSIKTVLGDYRVVLFVRPDLGLDVVVDARKMREKVRGWLEDGEPLGLVGIDRIEIYKL